MIVGMNEKLERLLVKYGEKESRVDLSDVMTCVAQSVAAGDSWYVPAEALDDGMNETDIEEGREIAELTGFQKMALTNEKKERFLCAFTSREAMTAHQEGTWISVGYVARAMLRDLLRADEFTGLVLNPWTEPFVIVKDDVEKLLNLADSVPETALASFRSYRLEPKAVIDANVILDAWREDWHDDEGRAEPWRLAFYPIMPDGHALLAFSMEGEIYGGNISHLEVTHTLTYYRVLEMGFENGKPEILNRYRFKIQDACVATVYLHDGVLYAVVSADGEEKYDVLQMVPNDDSRQFTIYRDVETLVTDSNGNLAAAYCRNLRDPARVPVMVFDPDGDSVARYHDEQALGCLNVNLDSGERVWFHLHPSATLDMLDPESKFVKTHQVALQGFDAFALSTDRSKLYVAFVEHRGGSSHYVMTADENGDYGNPMRFEFRPTDRDGKLLEAKDCGVFGRPSAMKSWVLLNADGCLYLYDIDDCCEQVDAVG